MSDSNAQDSTLPAWAQALWGATLSLLALVLLLALAWQVLLAERNRFVAMEPSVKPFGS